MVNDLDIVYEAIDLNNSISEDLKENFKELITIFHQLFGRVDLSNFAERIKKMKIKKGNKYVSTDAIKYLPRENTLCINPLLLAETDAKHELMFALLTLITAKDNSFGFDTDGKLKALNIGMTEMIANFLVGNEVNDYE